MPRSRLHSIILSLLALGVITAFFYYLYLNADNYLELLNISSSLVFSLVAISSIGMFINGLINTILFRSMGAHLSHRDGFVLAAASTLANQLPISGGMIAKGYYLKKRHNLAYTKFFSVSLAIFVCFVSVNGLIGIAILLSWTALKKAPISPFLWIGFAIMSACILLFWLPFDRLRIPNNLRSRVSQAIDGWMFISKNPIVGFNLVVLQTIMMFLLAGRYWLAFHMLSQNVSLGDVILFSSASVLTQLVSIAPGGLGITESIVGAVALALGFDMGVSVVAVGFDRLLSTSVILIIGGVSTIILGKEISDFSSPSKQNKE